MSAPKASTSTAVGQRQGTRQEVFESRGKRGTPGSGTTSTGAKASIYSNPLPLYISNNESLSLLWSITWTLSLSCQVLAAHLKSNIKSRNKVPKTAYLDEKIQGYWDERTKSVWILPTRRRKGTSKSNRRQPREGKNSAKQVESLDVATNETSSSTGVNEEGEEEETPWMDQLWKKGFFGKGSLSRSEPTWWQREKNRVTGEHVTTAEDITKARRAERIIIKKLKAQERADEKEKQVLALVERKKQEILDQSSGSSSSTPLPADPKAQVDLNIEEALVRQVEESLATTDAQTATEQTPDAQNAAETTLLPSTSSLTSETPITHIQPSRGTPQSRLTNTELATIKQETKLAELSLKVPNLEYTQLQREEVFFIALSSGAIDVYLHPPIIKPTTSTTRGDGEGNDEQLPIPLFELWDLFMRSSFKHSTKLSELEKKSIKIRPDNPFIISYLVYHHYRSLGWVVRNGVKFCADWVIYKGADGVQNMRGGAGPVGGHAEFAIAIIPTYEDASDALSSTQLKFRRDWRWLNTINRVNSGVKKTVILTFVTIPRLSDLKFDKTNGDLIDWKNPGCLKYYKIKEVSIRRFIPTRMRD